MSEEKQDLLRRLRAGHHGLGQLTLVEHALCPLGSNNLQAGLVHDSQFYYFNNSRHRQLAQAHIEAPLGLSASDEFYLWGLLALTLSQPGASFDRGPRMIVMNVPCLFRWLSRKDFRKRRCSWGWP